jgi:hypothetical protein
MLNSVLIEMIHKQDDRKIYVNCSERLRFETREARREMF